MIVISLSVIALGITLVVVFSNPKTDSGVIDNTTILTQSINDADPNISFDILINDSNIDYQNYIVIADMNDNISSVSYTKIDDNCFRVNSPKDGYTVGTTYRLNLHNGTKFASETYDTSNTFYFTIKKDETINVKLANNVKVLQDGIFAQKIDNTTIQLMTPNISQIEIGDIIPVVQ